MVVGVITGTLVLLRHGQSTFNATQRFTGLVDVPLTPLGEREAHAAAGVLVDAGLAPDVVLVSPLRRAADTADIVVRRTGAGDVPQVESWRLAERDYGCLTGLLKRKALERFGEPAFTTWRRTVDGRPPAASADEIVAWSPVPPLAVTEHIELGSGESLTDVVQRLEPCWEYQLRGLLGDGATVLVVAHGNSLRALCAMVEGLGPGAVAELNLPAAQPLVYRWDGPSDAVCGRYLDLPNALAALRTIAAEGGT